MTRAPSALDGLERLADAPALIHGRTVLSGADVLAKVRPAAGSASRSSGDTPEMLFGRLAATLPARTAPVPPPPTGQVDRLRLAYGDGVRRVVVFGDYAGAGGDAALAAWAAGAAVVCGHEARSPARALALLERTRADRAFASPSLLRALPEHPSAPLTDLGTLRVVVHCGRPLADGQTSLIADRLGVRVARVPHRDGACGAGDPVEAARVSADAGVAGIDLDSAVAAVAGMGRAALLSMLDALYRRGLFASPAAGHTEAEVLATARVAERHRGLVLRWLSALTAEGVVCRDGDRLTLALPAVEFTGQALERAWDEAERRWLATAGSTCTVDYARRSAGLLPDLLTGDRDAVSLLFPQGGTALAEALYRESVTARYQHHAVAGLLGAIAERRPRHRPLRVLEVGAGTGATTELALPALTASGADVAYLFTDVSPFFLERARRRWGGYPGVGFGRLDIDAPARGQEYAPGSYDVVLGGGVLNAARDTNTSIRSLAALLVPDGWLVLTEPTSEEYWVMITQAFLMPGARDARARTGATFLSLGQWRDVLGSAGLRRVVELPEPGHPLDRLGHRVFAARPSPAPTA